MAAIITVIQGDITQQAVDAIVNAANTTLLGGGGVDGAIHRVAGPKLLAQCRALGGCATGEARITKGYNLPAPWVIHTPGPVWHGGRRSEDVLLRKCYANCFVLVKAYGIKRVAFPSISTGAYRYPLEDACRIAVDETRRCCAENPAIEEVRFVCFDEKTFKMYTAVVGAGLKPAPMNDR